MRGKLLALRGEGFVTAAKVAGCTERVIMFRHLVPSFLSHIIASGTLAMPWMILGETALSFLGIGLQPPAISWGVLLKAAQNVKAIVATPWLLLPGLFVVAMILSFNFLGDGLRDAADPPTSSPAYATSGRMNSVTTSQGAMAKDNRCAETLTAFPPSRGSP